MLLPAAVFLKEVAILMAKIVGSDGYGGHVA